MRTVLVLALLAAVAAGGYWLAAGQRYRLYVDAHAARCWAAVLEITYSPSATRFRSVDGPRGMPGGLVETTIDFESSNLFAGTLSSSATCRFDPNDASAGRRATSIVVNGEAIDDDVLRIVNEAIAPE